MYTYLMKLYPQILWILFKDIAITIAISGVLPHSWQDPNGWQVITCYTHIIHDVSTLVRELFWQITSLNTSVENLALQMVIDCE